MFQLALYIILNTSVIKKHLTQSMFYLVLNFQPNIGFETGKFPLKEIDFCMRYPILTPLFLKYTLVIVLLLIFTAFHTLVFLDIHVSM